MVVAGCLAASVFVHAGAVSAGRRIVAIDRAAIPAEHRGRGWRDAGADVAGLAGESGGWGAETRRDGGRFGGGGEMLYGQHVTARHGVGEHVAFAGRGRDAAGYSTGGGCRR